MRHFDGAVRTRTNKHVPNVYAERMVRESLELIQGFVDGELLIPGADYNTSQSVVMSEHHPRERELRYYIFDHATHQDALGWGYEARIAHLNVIHQTNLGIYATVVRTHKCFNPADVEEHAVWAETTGYEGLILRDPAGIYKQGRSTIREQIMLKYVEYVREEAHVLGFAPVFENLDAGNSKKLENLVPLDRVGSLSCFNDRWGQFDVGSGWDHATGTAWWYSPASIIGKTITYKYKPYGTKDKPRQPIFVGFRTPEDM